MWSMGIEIPKASQVDICLSLDFNKFVIIQIIFIHLLIMTYRVAFFCQFSILDADFTGGPYKRLVCSKYKEMYQYGNIEVNLYRVMSMLKLKTNVNLPQLLCIVVSAAQNGEFERFGGFCVHCYHTLRRDKGGKFIFDRSSIKPIFTQNLESPGFQIEHQIT